jgi:hypothetical protein
VASGDVRIRQVKPAFWTDVRIASLPAPVRLFYIGLWMQADDAGWFRWDVPQIGAELYSFEGRSKRERNVAAFGDALEDAQRLARLDCGHAFIPTLAGHQRLSGSTKQVRTIANEHERDCSRKSPHVPAHPRESPARNGKEREQEREPGTERQGNGKVAGARTPSGAAPAEPTEFQRLVDRDVALGAKAS